MVRVKMSEIDATLTDQEERELHEADSMPIVYDEDSPEMNRKMLNQFHSFDSIPIRVTSEMVMKAKTYDKDYASFMSRLLALAFNDTELIKKCI